MADYITRLNVALDDNVSGTAQKVSASINSVQSAFNDAQAATRRFNDELKSWGAASQDTTRSTSRLNDAFVAISSTYAQVSTKFSEFKARTDAGKASLTDFGDVLRSFGLEKAGNAWDWLDKWTGAAERAETVTYNLSQRLRATREDFQILQQQMAAATSSAALTGPVSKNDAQAAISVFASGANFNTATMSLSEYANKANNLALVMGVSVPEAARKLSSAIDDTAAATRQAMNDGLVGFNQQLVDQIDLMQRSGDRAGALSAYMKALGRDIDGAAKPLTPFQKAMRELFDVFDTRGGLDSGPLDAFFKSIHDGMESAATVVVNKLKDIANAYFDFQDRITTKVFGPSTSPSRPPDVYGPQTVTDVPFNTGLSKETQNLLNSTFVSRDQDVNALIRRFASQIIPVESGDNQFDPRDPSKVLRSSAGALGIMQVMPATAAQYGADPTKKDDNILAGMALLNHLYEKYSGNLVLMAVAYNWGEGNADNFLLGKGLPPSETVNFVQKTTGVSADQFKAMFIGSYQQQAFAQQIQNDAAKAGDLGLSKQQRDNAALQQLLQTDLGNARDALSVAVSNGDQDGFSNAIARISDLSAKLQKAKGDATSLISETAKSAQEAAKNATLSGQTGIDKEIATIRQKYESIATRTGTEFDQSNFDAEVASKRIELANQEAQKQQELQKAYTDATAALVTQNQRSNDLIATIGQSTQAQQYAANAIKATTEADKAYSEDDPKRIQAIKDRTDALNQETRQQNDLAAARDVRAFEQQNELYQKQIDLLGASVDQQNQEIAALQERHKWGLTANDDLSEWQKKAVEAAEANAHLKSTLDDQKASLSDLSNIFTRSFDTIGDAITKAFLSGKDAAVSFGSVMKAVASQVAKDFLQLAVINPLSNDLFNTNKTTLSSGLAALGTIGTVSQATAAGNATSGGTAVFGGVGNILSLGGIADSLGLTNIGGQFSGLASTLGLTGTGNIFGGLGSGLSGVLNTPLISGLSAGQFGPVTSGLAAGGAGLPAGLTVGTLLGGAGAGFGVGSLLNSLAGGHSLGGTVGSGLGGLAGAAIGSIIPGIGTLIGGILGGGAGGLFGGVFGPGKANAYSSTGVGIANGQINIGRTLSQLVDTSGETAALRSQVNDISQFLSAYGIQVAGQRGTIQIGQNTPGGYVDPTKYSDLYTANSTGSTAFSQFRFGNSPNSGINKLLDDRSFSSLNDLEQTVDKFNDTMSAVDNFLGQTVPALTKTGQVTGSFNDQMAALGQQFDSAKAQADALIASGYLSDDQTAKLVQAEKDLADARDRATKLTVEQINAQTSATDISLTSRYLNAAAQISGSPQDALNASLYAFDTNADAQRKALSDQLVSIWGDSFKASSAYADQMAILEHTLGEERLAIQKQYGDQIADAQKQQSDAAAQAAQQAADQQKALLDQASQNAAGVIGSLGQYVQGLKIGSNSPLSPLDQYKLSGSELDKIVSSAANGNFSSFSEVQSYADAFLSSSRAINGSGVAYANDFSKVINAIDNLTSISPDTLTNSAFAAETRTQTQTLSDGLAELKQELINIKQQLAQNANAPARISA